MNKQEYFKQAKINAKSIQHVFHLPQIDITEDSFVYKLPKDYVLNVLYLEDDSSYKFEICSLNSHPIYDNKIMYSTDDIKQMMFYISINFFDNNELYPIAD